MLRAFRPRTQCVCRARSADLSWCSGPVEARDKLGSLLKIAQTDPFRDRVPARNRRGTVQTAHFVAQHGIQSEVYHPVGTRGT